MNNTNLIKFSGIESVPITPIRSISQSSVICNGCKMPGTLDIHFFCEFCRRQRTTAEVSSFSYIDKRLSRNAALVCFAVVAVLIAVLMSQCSPQTV